MQQPPYQPRPAGVFQQPSQPYQQPSQPYQQPSQPYQQPSQPYQQPYPQPGYAPGQMGAGAPMPSAGQKSWQMALILCLFLGVAGGHRFYTGHTGIGIAQLLTLGGCGIWTLIDLIMIVTNKYTDANGLPLLKQ
jgi:TM2 domain-containing membrane protein YozV